MNKKEKLNWFTEFVERNAITRRKNPNNNKFEWCICPKLSVGLLGEPIIFGTTIQETIECYQEMLRR